MPILPALTTINNYMRAIILTIFSLLILHACQPSGSGGDSFVTKEPSSIEEKASYAIGVDFGKRLKMQSMGKVEPAFIAQGIRDGLADTSIFTDEEIQDAIMAYTTQVKQNIETDNMSFLAENAKREEVKVTDSGLQYEVLEEADGQKPKASDEVTVHYTGTLIDGTKFDSSVDRGEPATFPLSGVIPGWTEGLQLMSVGSKYKFYIPSELGYGPRGAGNVIPPNATLIFEVELLSIN
jgi:FKBP-type peptidyl-prolyl cis-trans isomerase FkpA